MARAYGFMTLKELKDELKRRKARTSGRKAELVERLEAYDRNHNFGQQPGIVPDGLTLLLPPALSFVDLKQSFLEPGMDSSAITSYAELYGTEVKHTIYENRFLRYLKVSIGSSDPHYIRGEVRAEMKKKVAYIVNVVISKNSEILAAQCECAAGAAPTAHCKHVFVILKAVVDFSQSKSFLCEISKTQQLQTFHQPKKIYKGSPLKSSSLPRGNQKLHEVVFDPRPSRFVSQHGYPYLLRDRVINYKCNNPSDNNFPSLQLYLPANIEAVESDHDYNVNTPSDIFLEKIGLLNVDEVKALSIEESTREQSNSKRWHEERKIRLTSSRFGVVCKLTNRADKGKLCKSIVSPKIFTSKPTAHGRRFEGEAIRLYELVCGNKVKKCGLIINNEWPFLASSPDGLVGDDIVIEVKCPYAARDKFITPETVPYLEEHDGVLSLKRQHNYYYQIQGQLAISKRMLCHFVIFTFKQVKVIQILIDYVFVYAMLADLANFYTSHLKQAVLDKYFYLKQK